MLPFAMADALESASQEKVLKQLLDMAVALTQLKFCPISPFADTRSRGEDGVYIDLDKISVPLIAIVPMPPVSLPN